METLYLSTDAFAAETYLEDTEYKEMPIHKYDDITSGDGMAMVDRIGFNPMSSITFKKGTHINDVRKAIAEFHRQGIFATLVLDDGTIEKFLPKHLEFRRALVEAALRKGFDPGSELKRPDSRGYITSKSELDPAGYLFKLSNNPDSVK